MEICIGRRGLPRNKHVFPAREETLSLRFITSHSCVTRVSLAFRACLGTKNEAPERGRPGDMESIRKRATVGYNIPCKNMVHQQRIDPRCVYALHVQLKPASKNLHFLELA